jgi:hypothetical protein
VSNDKLVRLPAPEPDPEHCVLPDVQPASVEPASGLIVVAPENEHEALVLVSSAPANETAPSRAEIESAVTAAAVRGARRDRRGPVLCLGTVSFPPR